jgi:hypothetical protein
MLADMLLPLHQATAAAAEGAAAVSSSAEQHQRQQQQQQQIQMAVLSKVQGFVQALATARSDQEQQQLNRLLKTINILHAALPRDAENSTTAVHSCVDAAIAAAAAASEECSCGVRGSTDGRSKNSKSSSSSKCSSKVELQGELADVLDAAELIGLDSMKMLLRLDAFLQQQQQQQQHGLQAQLQEKLQALIEGVCEGQVLHDCYGFEALVPDQCRLEYWRICADANRQQPSQLDPCRQMQEEGSAQLYGMLQQQPAGSSWERVQLRRLLQEHAGLAGKEAEQLAAVSCKLSEQLLALQACSVAAAGRKPVVLRRTLIKKAAEAPTIQVEDLQNADDRVAEHVAANVAEGLADGCWVHSFGRCSRYEVLPGLRIQCDAAAVGELSGFGEATTKAASAGPVAAYGLAVWLVREALRKLPTLGQLWQQQQQQLQQQQQQQQRQQQQEQQQQQQGLDAADDSEANGAKVQYVTPAMFRMLLCSALQPRLQLLRQLHRQLQLLLLAATPAKQFGFGGNGVLGAPDASHLLRLDFQQQESLQQLLLLAAGVQPVAPHRETAATAAAAAAGVRRSRGHAITWRSMLPTGASSSSRNSAVSPSTDDEQHAVGDSSSITATSSSSNAGYSPQIPAEAAAAAAAAELASELRSICNAHQALLSALHISCEDIKPRCSLHPLQCPAGGQKWIAAAQALQHTWKQRVDALLLAFFDGHSSVAHRLQQQQQQQQQRYEIPLESSAAEMSSASSSCGRVHTAAPALLAGTEAALCSWAACVILSGLNLQAAHTAATQHEIVYKQAMAKVMSIIMEAAASKRLPCGAPGDEPVARAMQRHQVEIGALSAATGQRKELAEAVKAALEGWRGAVAAAEAVAKPAMQLLVLLQQDLAADACASLQQQQQQQGMRREGIEQLVLECSPTMHMLWQVLPLLLHVGSMQQPAAATAAEELVFKALGLRSKCNNSGSCSTGAAATASGGTTSSADAGYWKLGDSSASPAQLLPPQQQYAVENSMNRATAAALGVLNVSLEEASSSSGSEGSFCLWQLVVDVLRERAALSCSFTAEPLSTAAVHAAAGATTNASGSDSIAVKQGDALLSSAFVKQRVALLVEQHAGQRQLLLRQARQLSQEQQQQLAELLRGVCGGGSSSNWKQHAAAGDSVRSRLQQLLLSQQLAERVAKDAAASADGLVAAAEQAAAAHHALPADVAELLKEAAVNAVEHHSACIAAWQLVFAVKPSAARALHTLRLPAACRNQLNLEAAVLQWPPEAVAAAAGLQQQQQQQQQQQFSQNKRQSRNAGTGKHEPQTASSAAAAAGLDESASCAACCVCRQPGSKFTAFLLPSSLTHALAVQQQLGCCIADPATAAAAAAGGYQMIASAVCTGPACVSTVLTSLAAAGPPVLDSKQVLPNQQWRLVLQMARDDLLQLAPDMR